MLKTRSKKRWIIFGVTGAVLIAAVILLCIFAFSKPDPAKLLQESEKLSEQNLCLMAILEQEPSNAEAQAQLLANLKTLNADPLTIYALEQQFGQTAKAPSKTAPEAAGAFESTGGIAKLEDFEGAYSAATGGGTTYYATDEGIFADYRGLRLCIGSARAEQLIAAENGLYFLNLTQKRVQYIARDGHRIETLSTIEAQSYAFFNDQLWIAGADGILYCEEKPITTEGFIRTITATPTALYAAINDASGQAAGILMIDKKGTSNRILSSPAYSIYGGADGCLYYLDQNHYPARYDPAAKKASILKETKARLITYEEGEIYYWTEEGKIKEL